MMQTAPMAPSAPPMVAAMAPFVFQPDRPPWLDNPATGTSTPIRKYANPTHSSALSGLPSCIWPRASIAPYTPQEITAPATNHSQLIVRLVTCAPAAALGLALAAGLLAD